MGNGPILVLMIVLLMRSRMRWAICNTTSFSLVPRGPTAPGSSPPWPGSSATMMNRSVLCVAWADVIFESVAEAEMLGAVTIVDDALDVGALAVLIGADAVASGGVGVTGTAALFILRAKSSPKGSGLVCCAINASKGSATLVGYKSSTKRCW